MSQVIELVPNFSEGVNEDIISGLVRLAQSTPGASLLDYSADSNHNRTVLSLVGGPQAIKEVAFNLIEYAKDHIDLTQHKGAHPRMGATDVCPLIPLKDTSIEDCVDLAQKIAKRVGDELDIPVFLYEAAATSPHRKNIAKIRKGEFEGMADKIKEDKWQPDYGPDQLHPTAGATAIGARMPLVAFNVNLDTDNIDLAKRIAKSSVGLLVASSTVRPSEWCWKTGKLPRYPWIWSITKKPLSTGFLKPSVSKPSTTGLVS